MATRRHSRSLALAGALCVLPLGATRFAAADTAALAPLAGPAVTASPARVAGPPPEAIVGVASAADGVPLAVRTARFTAARPGDGRRDDASWTRGGFDDAAWSPALFNERTARVGLGPWIPAPRIPGPPPSPALMTVPFEDGQALHVRAVFDAPRASSFRQLEVRAAYADGIVVWLNGEEVARRGTGTTSAGEARAPVSHGPDPEAFYVALAPGKLLENGNVLAVEAWPGPGARSAVPRSPSLDQLTLLATTRVRIVRGPYWAHPTGEGATLKWETDLPSTGELRILRGGRLERHATARGTAHTVRLPRLGQTAGATYTVKTRSKDAGEADTPALPVPTFPRAERKTPLSFVVYGDMRAPGHAAHATVVAGVMSESPRLVLNTGDLVLIGSEEGAWQRYFQITRPLGAVAAVAPALGNHDAARGGVGARKTWELFDLPVPAQGAYTTSFDVAGVHFVFLDTNKVDEAQRAWLSEDLARARRHKARAIFALCHAGPFAHGVHGGDASVARHLAPVLAAAHVDMLFSGHDHLYERGEGPTPSGPLPYLVTGGGGAPLYEPSCRVPSRASEPTASGSGATPDPYAAEGVPPSEAAAAARQGAEPDGAKPLCPPWVTTLEKSYHYVVVTVGETSVRFCPKKPDGQPLEPCFDRPLGRR